MPRRRTSVRVQRPPERQITRAVQPSTAARESTAVAAPDQALAERVPQPGRLTQHDIMQMQRQYGNQAVQRLLASPAHTPTHPAPGQRNGNGTGPPANVIQLTPPGAADVVQRGPRAKALGKVVLKSAGKGLKYAVLGPLRDVGLAFQALRRGDTPRRAKARQKLKEEWLGAQYTNKLAQVMDALLKIVGKITAFSAWTVLVTALLAMIPALTAAMAPITIIAGLIATLAGATMAVGRSIMATIDVINLAVSRNMPAPERARIRARAWRNVGDAFAGLITALVGGLVPAAGGGAFTPGLKQTENIASQATKQWPELMMNVGINQAYNTGVDIDTGIMGAIADMDDEEAQEQEDSDDDNMLEMFMRDLPRRPSSSSLSSSGSNGGGLGALSGYESDSEAESRRRSESLSSTFSDSESESEDEEGYLADTEESDSEELSEIINEVESVTQPGLEESMAEEEESKAESKTVSETRKKAQSVTEKFSGLSESHAGLKEKSQEMKDEVESSDERVQEPTEEDAEETEEKDVKEQEEALKEANKGFERDPASIDQSEVEEAMTRARSQSITPPKKAKSKEGRQRSNSAPVQRSLKSRVRAFFAKMWGKITALFGGARKLFKKAQQRIVKMLLQVTGMDKHVASGQDLAVAQEQSLDDVSGAVEDKLAAAASARSKATEAQKVLEKVKKG